MDEFGSGSWSAWLVHRSMLCRLVSFLEVKPEAVSPAARDLAENVADMTKFRPVQYEFQASTIH